MKITLTRPQLVGAGNYAAGTVVDLPDGVAKKKIRDGAAIPYVAPLISETTVVKKTLETRGK